MTRRPSSDAGFTLIELFVVMSILGIALAMFGNALFQMQRSSAVQEEVGNATDEVRIAFAEMERQVRAAYWIDPAVAGDTIQLYTKNASGALTCVGWKVENQQLWRRDAGGAWKVIGSGDPAAAEPGPIIVNAALGIATFTPGAAIRVSNPNDPMSPYLVPPSLAIDLRVDEGDSTPVQFVSTLTARNVPRRGVLPVVIPC